VFSGVFIAEEFDGVRDRGSGDIRMVCLQTLLEAFLNMSLRSACFVDEAFFQVKSKTSALETTLIKCQNIRFFGLLELRVHTYGHTYIHTYIYIYIHRSNIHTSWIGYGFRQEQSTLQYAIKSKHRYK
jgi:hypothetical protein